MHSDLVRALVEREIRRDRKFAAKVLGTEPQKILSVNPTDDGCGLAVYYWPKVKRGKPVWLLGLGYDGRVYGGDRITFAHVDEAIRHAREGGWREVWTPVRYLTPGSASRGVFRRRLSRARA